ncbi:MAG: MFS transporter [Gemmatimonadaceae bacterium]|nr:MFS transporter [Gemmatimonadaceae bacterium]
MALNNSPATITGDLNPPLAPPRERWSWALYDFSNTIFSMNITTLFFSAWIVADLGVTNTKFAIAKGIVAALVILSIPLFGAVSDTTQRRKPWIVVFTIICCMATAAIGIVGQTMVPAIGDSVRNAVVVPNFHLVGVPLLLILTLYVIADYTYQGAMPFYNAMLPELAPPEMRGRLSGLGTGVGYVGSIAGILIAFPFFNGTLPIVGKFSDSTIAALGRLVPFSGTGGNISTFVPTALLFLIFSLPLFFFCKDHNVVRDKAIDWGRGFRDVAHTIRETKKYPGLRRFILTTFLYQDAMGTIIANMTLFAIYAMGFTGGAKITLFLVLTIPAVLGSYPIGKLVDRIGPKRTLIFVISSWILLLIAMVLVPTKTGFWIVGFGIGLIFGGTATAERPLLLTLVPDKEAGRFFSLLVLSSRAAAIVGPFVWAFAVDGLTPGYGAPFAYRMGVVTVAIAMIGSLWMLRGLPETPPTIRREAPAK